MLYGSQSILALTLRGQKVCTGLGQGGNPIPCILCANKSDMWSEEKVPFEEAEAWGRAVGMPVIRTSARTGMNIDRVFHKLAQITPRKGDMHYKVAVIGDGGVGKTAICVKFVLSCFVNNYVSASTGCLGNHLTLVAAGSDYRGRLYEASDRARDLGPR